MVVVVVVVSTSFDVVKVFAVAGSAPPGAIAVTADVTFVVDVQYHCVHFFQYCEHVHGDVVVVLLRHHGVWLVLLLVVVVVLSSSSWS